MAVDLNLNLNTIGRRGSLFSTADLSFEWSGRYEDSNLLNSKGENPTYVSGTGLDAIYDFSVLSDVRLDKSNATYWGSSIDSYFYYDVANPYHYKLKDFHYRYFEDQMVSDNNFAFGKLNYTATILQGVSSILIYSTEQINEDLILLKSYINQIDTFYNVVYQSNFALLTDDINANFYSDNDEEIYTSNGKLYIVEKAPSIATKPIVTRNTTTVRKGDNLRVTISGDQGVIAGNYWFAAPVTDDNHNLSTSGDYIRTGVINSANNIGERLYTYYNGNLEKTSIITSIKAEKVYEKYYLNEDINSTDEIIIKDRELNKAFGFGSISYVGNRLYSFYRNGTNHLSMDGILDMKYSDNNGTTWSEPETIYTGIDVLTAYPQILIDDPDATTDVRDIYSLQMNDDYLLIFGFVAAGETGAIVAFIPFCLKVPIVNNTLDFDNKIISYLPNEEPFTGGAVVHNSIIYSSTYELGIITFYKSTDGINWLQIGQAYGGVNPDVTECCLVFIDNILYAYARGGTQMVIAKSIDYGYNWTDYTEVGSTIAHPECMEISDGYILILGRDNIADNISFNIFNGLSYLNTSEVIIPVNSDAGYGNIIYKNGVYYYTYMYGCKITGDISYSHTGWVMRTMKIK